jgi:Transposase
VNSTNTIYSANSAYFTYSSSHSAHSTYLIEVTNSSNRPQTPSSSNTTRDQRLQAQTLHNISIPCSRISEQLNLTLRQVRYAINYQIMPKKPSGRPSILIQKMVDYIIIYVCASKANRRTLLTRIPILLELNTSFYCIRTALRNAGFSRRIARRKPPISERNRIARLHWAIEHVGWTIDDWKKILWSDETWVNGDCYTKIYVI